MIASKHKRQPKSYAYLNRVQVFDRTQGTETQYNFKYILTGVARNTISGIQIYRTYFPDIYKKTYRQLCASLNLVNLPEINEKEHLSIFFILFLDIYILKDCVGLHSDYTTSQTITHSNILGQYNRNQSRSLSTFITRYINHCHQGKFQQFFKIRSREYNYFQSINGVQNKIKQLMKQFEKKLNDKQEWQKIKKTEYLPCDKMDDQESKQLILYHFQCIRNIHVPRSNSRKEVLSQFQDRIRLHMFIKIQLLMETLAEANKDRNSVHLPKYSKETYPILTPFLHFLRFHDRLIQEQCQDKQQYRQQQLQIYKFITNIIKTCLQFYVNTKIPYPNISISDIHIDLKTMKPVISYNSLILDAIGFRGQTKHIELRIATQPTPNSIFQIPYFLKEQEQYYFLRKYYTPEKAKSSNNEENDQQKPTQESIVLEKVHVWRLLTILYEIYHLSHLTNDLYYKISSKKYYQPQEFKKAIQKIYKDLTQGALKFDQLIPSFQIYFPQEQKQKIKLKKKIDNLDKFQLKIPNLAERFGIDASQKDLLFQNLKMTNTKEFLQTKQYFANQIIYIALHQKTFKRLLNAKKYVISLCTSLIQELRLKIVFRNSELKGINFSTQLDNQLRKASYYRDFDKRNKTIKQIWDKFLQYKQRRDPNGRALQETVLAGNLDYIKQSIKEIEDVQTLLNKIKEIQEWNIQDQLSLIKKQFNKEITTQDMFVNDDIAIFIRKMQDSKYSSQKLIEESKNLLNSIIATKSKPLLKKIEIILLKFVEKQVRPYINEPSKLHSLQDYSGKQQKNVFKYVNLKLLAVIDMYLISNEQNFRKFQHIYGNSTFDIIREGKRFSENIQEFEITRKINGIEMFTKQFRKEPTFNSFQNALKT